MLLVLPIIPSSESDASVLLTEVCGKPLLLHLAERLATVRRFALRVFTTDSEMKSRLESAGIAVEYEPAGEEQYISYHDGVLRALSYLLKHEQVELDSRVVVLDCRNPFMSTDTIEECVSLLASDASDGLATFENVRDHPLQLFNVHRISLVDMYVFLEPQSEASSILRRFCVEDECVVSSKFYFDWRGADVWGQETAAYVVDSHPRAAMAGMRRVLDPLRALSEGRKVLLWESPWSARRLFPAGTSTDADAARSALGRDACPLLMIRRESGAVTVSSSSGGGGHGILRIWPFVGNELGAVIEQEVPAGVWSARLPVQPAFVDGFLGVLLEQPSDGTHDYIEHITGSDLWAIDPVTKRPMEPESGRLLCNRQDFPQLAVLDDAVFGGTVERLQALGDLGRSWRMLSLGGDERIKVRTPLDVLWAESNASCGTSPDALSRREGFAPSAGDASAMPADETDSRQQEEGRPDARAITDVAGLERFVAWHKSALCGAASVDLPSLAHGEDGGFQASVDFEPVAGVLSESVWVCDNIRAMVSAGKFRGGENCLVDAIVEARRVQCSALLNEFLELEVGICNRAIRDARSRVDVDQCGAGRKRKDIHMVEVPEQALPVSPQILTSDGVSTLFMYAHSKAMKPGLFSKDLDSGAWQDISYNEASYCGVWFDVRRDFLYTMFYADAAGQRTGIDVFHKDGKHEARVFFDENKFHNPQALARLHGNEKSLFFIDYACGLIYEIDKYSFDVVDVHQHQIIAGASDFKCSDSDVYIAVLRESVYAKINLSNRKIKYYSSEDTIFPSLIEYDRVNNNIVALTMEKIPSSSAPLRHFLKIFDFNFNMLHSADLGPMFVRGMDVLGVSRRVVLADHNAGIRCVSI
ncbi:hypothetical protein [Fundidesulfovibrio terrae]|uniref:hypothetical protein n=1 Tax=Fundidesulfovibrio terrae TaxID=2922866 RepID=UPI001FAFED31|nr:hypothetical protein [Fundidesulfovibrio terrae]